MLEVSELKYFDISSRSETLTDFTHKDDNTGDDDNYYDDNDDDNDVQPVLELCSLPWVQHYPEVHKCAHLCVTTITITITNVDTN